MLTAALALGLLVLACGAHAKICNSKEIRNYPQNLTVLNDCEVILGDLKVMLIEDRKGNQTVPKSFRGLVFPKLRQVLDFVLVFNVELLESMGQLFPNLRVIHGRKRFMGSSLVLVRAVHLKEINLTGLHRISRGNVYISDCPNLCYVHTVNWTSLGTTAKIWRTPNPQDCPDCPNNCTGPCWNGRYCQEDYHEDEKTVKCPEDNVIEVFTGTCMTKERCVEFDKGKWWVFNGTCIDSCPIYYDYDKDVKEKCRYMGDNYTRICNIEDEINTKEQLENLDGCTHINGSLTINLWDKIDEVLLEPNLKHIVSINGYLMIKQLKMLTSFSFFKSLREINGTSLTGGNIIFIVKNYNLQKLWDYEDGDSLTLRNGSVTFHDNPLLCSSEIIRFNETVKYIGNEPYSLMFSETSCNEQGINITIVNVNPTKVTIMWKPFSSSVLGYFVYYKRDTGSQMESEECTANSWKVIFKENTTISLDGLTPFTRYNYYIKTVSNPNGSDQKHKSPGYFETPIYNFTTASSKPSQPLNFEAKALSSTSVILRWEPPLFLNGNLTQYHIFYTIEKDRFPNQRDYCLQPIDVEIKVAPTLPTNTTKSSNCTCPKILIFEEDLTCSKDDFACGVFSVHKERQDNFSDYLVSQNDLDFSDPSVGYSISVGPKETSYVFNNFSHYTMYIFYLKACNAKNDNYSECSFPTMIYKRTTKREDADFVRDLNVKVKDRTAELFWYTSDHPNSLLLAYNIEYKKKDSENSKPQYECITATDYNKTKVYQISPLAPGSYVVRVQAVSLAGPGAFSQWMPFELYAGNSSVFVIVGPIIVIVLLFIILGFVWWYRRKYLPDRNHLITSINPDYVGPIYVEDQWEIDRADIEIDRKMGSGSFGLVYEGKIISRQYPCAVKTVNDDASTSERMEFLNEGSLMKMFSDSHHVIKLLGIVSRGQPPLVVMELMERGDLKSYLRRCREPSQNLTSNEMYRMAAEIADGMAYLCAKKFIHRDLAARNCMVAGDRTVKIGDFGMARDIYLTDYYRKDTPGLLPVRWMAPESLADGVFTSDSDVWSYGVVLWEMATLAEQPYQGYSNQEVLSFVKTGGKLERPTECSDLLYEVMSACWEWRPNDRPTFTDIVSRLESHVGPDFRLVAFCFSRQGRELALQGGKRIYNPPAMSALPEECRYDAIDDEVDLRVGDRSRPKYMPFSSQRIGSGSSDYDSS